MRFVAATVTLASLAAAALPAAVRAQATAAAAPFEGVVTMNVGERPAPMTYSVRQGMMRLDLAGPAGRQSAVILDGQAHRMLVLLPGQQMYFERPFSTDSVRALPHDRPKITKTGRTEQVAGYACEHWMVEDQQGHTADACMAQGIGAFAGMQGPMGPGGRSAPWLSELGEGGWFPLKVTREGATTPVLEVTKIERHPVDASLFTVPDGWRKMDFPAGGMGRPGAGAGR